MRRCPHGQSEPLVNGTEKKNLKIRNDNNSKFIRLKVNIECKCTCNFKSVSLTSIAFVLIIFGSTILLANYTRYTVNKEELDENMKYLINKKNHAADEFLIFLYYRVSLHYAEKECQ